MTKTEQLLIEAREIARRTLGVDVSNEIVGQVFDVLAAEQLPGGLGDVQDEDGRTLH